MSSYGFGYDEEVPGGYQDADLEMLELEELGRNSGRLSSPSSNPPDLVEEPRTLELDGGQLTIGADVIERNGQLVLEELARPPVPAPLNHIPEHPADDLYQLCKEA